MKFNRLESLNGIDRAPGRFLHHSHQGNRYKLFVPGGYNPNQPAPLVVMLHGCTQDADDFAAGTKMNELAEDQNFFVLYPEQSFTANSNKCWNWFYWSHQERGKGEPAVIAGMVNEVKSHYSIDDNRVFIAGLSAGGAMSVIMAVAYPDLFSAVGVSAGLEYKAARSVWRAYAAMENGGPNPVRQGMLAYEKMGQNAAVMPIIVFHGTNDQTVALKNANQLITQWSITNDLAKNGKVTGWINDQPDETVDGHVPSGRKYKHHKYQNADGKILMEKIVVEGMEHAWSGGSPEGSYTDSQGPDASRIMWEFFMEQTNDATETEQHVSVPQRDSWWKRLCDFFLKMITNSERKN
ncbi:alpha/beta hydrolase family esterase [Bacillus songklensis]|uniref:Alpha/beta hydrolase family esterase n=1 Tax=Bacillus songklensis TaxID=1069116 RepID=A0ABV8B3N1_9BACI